MFDFFQIKLFASGFLTEFADYLVYRKAVNKYQATAPQLSVETEYDPVSPFVFTPGTRLVWSDHQLTTLDNMLYEKKRRETFIALRFNQRLHLIPKLP